MLLTCSLSLSWPPLRPNSGGKYNFLPAAWSTFISLSKLGAIGGRYLYDLVSSLSFHPLNRTQRTRCCILKQSVQQRGNECGKYRSANSIVYSFALITFWWSDYRVGSAVGVKWPNRNGWSWPREVMGFRVVARVKNTYWSHSANVYSDALECAGPMGHYKIEDVHILPKFDYVCFEIKL